eukprot:SAG31_NODE_26994_length_433_cov_0.598802_1_plen_35_part_10
MSAVSATGSATCNFGATNGTLCVDFENPLATCEQE